MTDNDRLLELAVSLRPEVQAFAHLMERKLQANDHKGGWKDCTADYLLGRLADEFVEFGSALLDGDGPQIADEAADLANIAMMLCDTRGVLPTVDDGDVAEEVASELLSALKVLCGVSNRTSREHWMGYTEYDEAPSPWEMAERAIAKAEGRGTPK